MKTGDLLASAAIHAAAVGAAVAAMRLCSNDEEEEERIAFFEIIEEAAEAKAAAPAPSAPDGAPPSGGVREEKEETEDAVEKIRQSPLAEERHPEDAAPLAAEREDPPRLDEERPPRGNPADAAAPAEQQDAPPPAPESNENRAKTISAPHPLGRIVPSYPRRARRKGHEGDVSLELVVSESGAIESAAVVASSGHGELDAAALDAVKRASFAPATEDGAAVRGKVRLKFGFRLQDGDGM